MSIPGTGVSPRRVALSGVRTQTHLVYVASWLRSAVAGGADVLELVDLDAALDRPRVGGGAAVVSTLAAEVPGVVAGGGGPVDTYVAVGAPGLKPLLRLVRAAHRKPVTVVVDDGIGSYGTWSTRRAALVREGAGEPWASVRAAAVESSRRMLTSQRWALFVRSGGRWVVHDPVGEEFRRHVAPVAVEAAGQTVVYLAQPWVELGLVGVDEYRARLTQLGAEVAEVGMDLAIRPHPTSSAELHRGLRVIDGDGPAELDPAVQGARLLVGETSSALINAAALFGTPACRLDGPVYRQLAAGLSPAQRGIADAFVPDVRPIGGIAEILG